MFGEDHQLLMRGGYRRRDLPEAIGRAASQPRCIVSRCGVKISSSRLASSCHLVSVPLRRTASARSSKPLQSFDFGPSSSMVRAAVAWSRTSSSASSTSSSGASSRSSTVFRIQRAALRCDNLRSLAAALQHFQLTQTAFQPFAPPPQRLVNGLRGRGQPALQDGECKSDRACAFVIFQGLGTVEFLAHVIGDFFV